MFVLKYSFLILFCINCNAAVALLFNFFIEKSVQAYGKKEPGFKNFCYHFCFISRYPMTSNIFVYEYVDKEEKIENFFVMFEAKDSSFVRQTKFATYMKNPISKCLRLCPKHCKYL